MPVIGATNYGPAGGMRTTVGGGPTAAPNDGLLQYVQQRMVAKERAEQLAALQAQQAAQQAAVRSAYARATAPRVVDNSSRASGPVLGQAAPDPLAHDRMAAEKAKLDAISKPPPMKWTYPYGTAGFLTMDVDNMTGAQRQMFLPQNSTNDAEKDAKGQAIQDMAQAAEFGAIDKQHNEAGGVL